MKHITVFIVFLSSILLLSAQNNKYSTFYYQRATLFEKLPVTQSDIIFLGNSITNGAEWAEIFDNPHIKNRGISGDIMQGVYDRLAPITKGKPAKIFLMIGINDIAHGISADSIVSGITKIADRIALESPRTKLYIQSLLPVNDTLGMFAGHTSRGAIVKQANEKLKVFCQNRSLVFVDLYSAFKNSYNDKMNLQYSNDGLHLLGAGYMLWKQLLLPYITK